MDIVSKRAKSAAEEIELVFDFFSRYRDGVAEGDVVADFTFGNPHEMPLPGLVKALKDHAEPRRVDWFAYKTSEQEPRETIATALQSEIGLPFSPDDIVMTQGAFGAIGLAIAMLTDPGDECIIPVPGWFCYATVLRLNNAVPVRVALEDATFDLDIGAIEKAITKRTRIVVVNAPHNPTGVIYTRERLEELGAMLKRKSQEVGRPIFILSDEPYRRIRFDGHGFTSPAEVYPWTLIDYSYGKILLAPGLRLGYMAICPNIPDTQKLELRTLANSAQVARGWAFPDAPLQYAVADLETVSIDIAELQRKRDRFFDALAQWSYRMTKPAGTFYLWGAAPGGDSVSFAAKLARQGIFVMPGTLFERPGDFRISLTGTAEMIEASLPAFRDLAGGK